MHGVGGDLAAVRGEKVVAAAQALGVAHTAMCEFADGHLPQVGPDQLSGEVTAAARAAHADGLLAFDTSGVTGHQDHAATSPAALLAAADLNLPVLGWTLPASVAAQLNRELATNFVVHPAADIGIELPVKRMRQLAASHAHVSQAISTSVLWRRLQLLGDTEHLRYLRRTRVTARGFLD